LDNEAYSNDEGKTENAFAAAKKGDGYVNKNDVNRKKELK